MSFIHLQTWTDPLQVACGMPTVEWQDNWSQDAARVTCPNCQRWLALETENMLLPRVLPTTPRLHKKRGGDHLTLCGGWMIWDGFEDEKEAVAQGAVPCPQCNAIQ